MVYGEGLSWPEGSKKPFNKANFIGPMEIDKVEGLNCTLKLPPALSNVTNRFHMERLRRYVSPELYFPSRKFDKRPPPTMTDFGATFEIDKILGSRVMKKGKKGMAQFLVKWKGYSEHELDWIDYDPLNKHSEPWSARDKKMITEFDKDLVHLAEEGGTYEDVKLESSLEKLETKKSKVKKKMIVSLDRAQSGGSVKERKRTRDQRNETARRSKLPKESGSDKTDKRRRRQDDKRVGDGQRADETNIRRSSRIQGR